MGIEVADANLPDNVSGALVKKVGFDPQILLSPADSPNRKRFSCAHEIGHYVRRAETVTGADDEYEYVDLRGALSGQGIDQEEVFANQFAANLLMPEREVRQMVEGNALLVQMMSRFGVSQDAMRYRLINLGLG